MGHDFEKFKMPELSPQLQLVTMGLQGSGKTTTCFSLAQLLHGRWLNQV
jgi:signal recognition particle GTPase